MAPKDRPEWMLKPGIYLVSRNVIRAPFGAHQHLACIFDINNLPSKPGVAYKKFHAYGSDLQVGFTLGAGESKAGHLVFIPNEEDDVKWLGNYIASRRKKFEQSTVAVLELRWTGAETTNQMAAKLVTSSKYYRAFTNPKGGRPLTYSNYPWNPMNSNMWAQSLIHWNMGASSRRTGIHKSRTAYYSTRAPIPKEYFQKTAAAKLPKPSPRIRKRTQPKKSSAKFQSKPTRGYWYRIRSGDTLGKICAAAYNNPQKYKAVVRHPKNRQRISNAHDIRVGQAIFLPRI